MQQASLTVKDILDRPANGIVLVVASGAGAGEMIGIDEIEWSVGFDADCRLRFSKEEYPALDSKVTCRKTPQGWMLKRVRGENVFINQSQIDERTPIRSGDIVRLGPKGPDFQFNLQNAGFSVKSLVGKYMPDQPVVLSQPTAKPRPTTPTKSIALGTAADTSPAAQVRSQISTQGWSPRTYGLVFGCIFLLLLAVLFYFAWSGT